MTDFSFLKLYKNDFFSAKLADNKPIQKLRYGGFIVQKPDEYFLQTTASDTSISFVGTIQVDLVDCNDIVQQNIDSNFYYVGFVDSNGINQISFAFGFIGVDYFAKQLYLKITDLVNGNIWYSNGFLVTNYRTDLSVRFDYFNQTKINNVSYDLAPYIQSIRLTDCYEQDFDDETQVKEYKQSQGNLVQYRSIITDLDNYVFSGIDKFTFRRLERLFTNGLVYLNNQRIVKKELKKDKRAGDTNYFNAELSVNPQNEKLVPSYQIYQYLNVVSKTPIHLGTYTTASLPNVQLTFNKNITLLSGFEIKLYKGGVLQTIAPTIYNTTGNVLDITPPYVLTNGDYMIVIEPNAIVSGAETFEGIGANEWTFMVANGEFDATEFDNTEFLTT